MKTKFITAIYCNLFGTDYGGRPNRSGHYRWSLLSILKMTDGDFICYTSQEELLDLEKFFHEENLIPREKLNIVAFDLSNHYFLELFKKYKDYEGAKRGDRCIELQYMKFIWYLNENNEYDKYFWIDAGLSHCGLIPNKYLSLNGPHNRGYYESLLFNNKFLKNLIEFSENKFVIIGKENDRNYWSGTVNRKHFKNYDRTIHIIGGLFGGNKLIWDIIVDLFKNYAYKVTVEDNKLYHEEDIMTLMFRNHPELFKSLNFDTWYHADAPIPGLTENHFETNKSFYKILEELQ
jgi:hypothetical protein